METKKKIRQFIESHLVLPKNEAYFTDRDDIFKMGIVNSLFAMRILNYVEREFDIEVESQDMELENFCSVNNIIKFLESKRG